MGTRKKNLEGRRNRFHIQQFPLSLFPIRISSMLITPPSTVSDNHDGQPMVLITEIHVLSHNRLVSAALLSVLLAQF